MLHISSPKSRADQPFSWRHAFLEVFSPTPVVTKIVHLVNQTIPRMSCAGLGAVALQEQPCVGKLCPNAISFAKYKSVT